MDLIRNWFRKIFFSNRSVFTTSGTEKDPLLHYKKDFKPNHQQYVHQQLFQMLYHVDYSVDSRICWLWSCVVDAWTQWKQEQEKLKSSKKRKKDEISRDMNRETRAIDTRILNKWFSSSKFREIKKTPEEYGQHNSLNVVIKSIKITRDNVD